MRLASWPHSRPYETKPGSHRLRPCTVSDTIGTREAGGTSGVQGDRSPAWVSLRYPVASGSTIVLSPWDIIGTYAPIPWPGTGPPPEHTRSLQGLLQGSPSFPIPLVHDLSELPHPEGGSDSHPEGTLVPVRSTVQHGEPIPHVGRKGSCLLYTSPSPRDRTRSRMPSSA